MFIEVTRKYLKVKVTLNTAIITAVSPLGNGGAVLDLKDHYIGSMQVEDSYEELLYKLGIYNSEYN
jgi:hypothetical protein